MCITDNSVQYSVTLCHLQDKYISSSGQLRIADLMYIILYEGLPRVQFSLFMLVHVATTQHHLVTSKLS